MIDAPTEDAGPARGGALAEGRATERTVDSGDPLARGADADEVAATMADDAATAETDDAASAEVDGCALATVLTRAGSGAGSSSINMKPTSAKGRSTSVSFRGSDAARHDAANEKLEATRGASGPGTSGAGTSRRTSDAVAGRPAAGTGVAPEARRTSSTYS
jgi:hypothetical protein